MKRVFTLVVIALFALPVFAQQVGSEAPDFTLKDLNDADYTLSANKGKVLLFFIVGYNCPLCLASANDVKTQVVDVFKSNENFEAVVVDVWNGSKSAFQGFKSQTGIDAVYLQKGSSVASSWGTTYDRLVVIDSEGKIAFKGNKAAKSDVSGAKTAIQTALNNVVVTSVTSLENESGFGLGQNYPNPVREFTRIAFKIDSSSDVRLSVFDLTGKLVSVPVNGYYQRGEHIVEIRRNDLQKGLYLYRLEADGFSASRRMIVN